MTLFAYQAKKSRVESGSDSNSDSLDKSGEDDSDSHSDDDDTNGALSKTNATVSGDETTVYQDNQVTVDKPSGSMTIIINNRSSTPAASSTSSTSTGQSLNTSTSGANSVVTVPTDISVGAHQPPVQPSIRYPSSSTGTKRRAFNSDWFSKYSWLEYSKERDSVYCYACRIFAVSAKKSDTFTHIGYRDWKHATGQNGSLAKHDSSCTHKQAMLYWAEYVNNADRNTSIGDRLDSTRKQQIQGNRCYLKTIAEKFYSVHDKI